MSSRRCNSCSVVLQQLYSRLFFSLIKKLKMKNLIRVMYVFSALFLILSGYIMYSNLFKGIYVYFCTLIFFGITILTEENQELIKRFWKMKIAPKFSAIIPIGHVLGVLFIISLTSCGDEKYNVQLKDGSIVEAINKINSYNYKKGDTVCISYSNAWDKWYFEDSMKDTTYFYGGHYRYSKFVKDSVYVPLSPLKYRIGIIK